MIKFFDVFFADVSCHLFLGHYNVGMSNLSTTVFFNHFLRERGVTNEVRSLLYHMARSAKYINFSLRAGNTGKSATFNETGDQQVDMDLLSDRIIYDEIVKSELVSEIVSEERDSIEKIDAPRGNFLVAYDPLDGSSLVEADMAIGTIFGIWDKDSFIGTTAREGMLAACYAIYGPQVRLVIAIKGKGTHEFEMNDVGEFVLTREDIQIKEGLSKYFAPGNLKCSQDNERYFELVSTWIKGCRTLRYSGCMIPDIHHILAKGEGIFTYPSDSERPEGKLRVLYECAPFSLVMEEAGGASWNQDGEPILDTVVTDCHQKTPIFCGTKQDVKTSIEFLKG